MKVQLSHAGWVCHQPGYSKVSQLSSLSGRLSDVTRARAYEREPLTRSPALPHLPYEVGTPADAPCLGRGGLYSNQALTPCTVWRLPQGCSHTAIPCPD